MTTAQLMFFGGIGGVVISVIGLVISLSVFSCSRKKKLESIMKSL